MTVPPRPVFAAAPGPDSTSPRRSIKLRPGVPRPEEPAGFTLMEVILSIVLVGILMPTVIIPFSGIKDTKIPEYVTQASWLGVRQMEAIADETSLTLPAAGTYTCANFSAAMGSKVDCNFPDYTFDFLIEDVAAANPDTGGAAQGFGVKVTLTVSRVDGQISGIEFYGFF